MLKTLIAAAGLEAFSCLAAGTQDLAGQQPQPPAEAAPRAAEILLGLAEAPLDAIWDDASALEGLGRGAIPALKAALASPQEGARLAAGWALCGLGEPAEACEALAALARKGTPPARGAAVRILGMRAGTAAARPLLALVEDASLGALDRIAASESLWRCVHNPKAAQYCRSLLADADAGVRDAAVLALGDMGQALEARPQLEALALAPTLDGDRARAILLRDQLSLALDAQSRPEVRQGEKLLGEIASMIRQYYVDDRSDIEELFDAAAKGLASSLDPHSSYMGKKEVEQMNDRMEGHYAGVGAVVSKENGVLVVVSTFFDGPAWNAGIRSGDIISTIEGHSAADYSIEDAVKRLKGNPGTPVSLEIVRRGVSKPIPFTLKRAVINLSSVYSAMLPGKVGYVHLTQFVKQSDVEVLKAIDALEKDGMRTLVFDLRDNGGGLLQSAVAVADLFLKPGKLIVYSEGRNPEVAPREDYVSGGRLGADGRWINPPQGKGGRAQRPDYPISVLVNHGSASASEIVSGALRDHGRALLVGEKTFGKGSVQQLRHLAATDKQTILRLTVAKYYLPSGRCIHGVGVEPDVASPSPDLPGWKFEEYRRLQDADVFTRYLDGHPVKGDAALAALAEDDGRDPARYPGFDAWFDGLKTTLSRDDVRLFLRRLLRDKVAEDRGRLFTCDLSDDPQLQRAAVEALKRGGIDPLTVPELARYVPKEEVPKDAPPAK